MKTVSFRLLTLITVLAAGVFQQATAIGGGPQSPDDVASACQMEMFALRDAATAALQAELTAFDTSMGAISAGAVGVDVARLGAATSARLDKIGLKAIAAINKSANRCIGKLNRIGADVSYINGTDAQRISIVTILGDSLRFSAQAAVAAEMVEFMDQ